MRYFTPSTRHRILNLIDKLNKNEEVTLSERILLSKYLSKIPTFSGMIKEELIKFS
tara:strand:- start:5072 stop:5239 length:168 start_codon:yes stop_codon:yes gene_type:complete